jgi:uncharacterized protein (DUF1800 family)
MTGILDRDARHHLLRRFAFAATPANDSTLDGLDRNRAFAALWAASANASEPARPDFLAPVWRNSALAHSNLTKADLDTRRESQLREHQQQTELLRQAWIEQMVRGPALRETLTLFFHGFFGSSSAAVEIPQALYQRLCMTSLPELLEALVLDPAMMLQIGMHGHTLERVSDRPAKLILDFWTVGEGAYSNRDLEELSRSLTGWSLGDPENTAATDLDRTAPRISLLTGLTPRFNGDDFDPDPKTLFGATYDFDARSAIRLLALQPATAERFAVHLIDYFGVADRDGALRARLKTVYLSSKGSMREVLSALATSDAFWSEESRWSLIKSPVHLVVSACRPFGAQSLPLPALSRWLTACGQTLFDTANNGEGGWAGGQAWITPANRLAIRYQLPRILAGEAPVLSMQSSRESGPTAPALNISVLQTQDARELVRRFDPAVGFELDRLTARERAAWSTIRAVMASPHFQLA